MATKMLVGNIADIDVQGARTVTLNGTEIALFHLSDGRVLAVENRCPHKGGKLAEGMVCGGYVHCPLHDWRIDLHSGTVQEPDEGSVATFRTEVDKDGYLYVVVQGG